jgi:hypothetical protein
MTDLEKRIADLERRVSRIEPYVERTMPLGPNPKHDEKFEEERAEEFKKICEVAKKRIDQDNDRNKHKCAEVPPVDRSAQELTDGNPVTDDHREINPTTGMQKGYVVLTAEERSKGFVRPVRHSYRHVGPLGFQHALRDLTDEEKTRYLDFGYVKFETYPPSDSSVIGKFWKQKDLDAIEKGCGTITTMGSALAETYARDPKFYGGTFCCGCGKHFTVSEFVWDGTTERVGS